ncbi:alpha/beta hydrolase [Staphylococcus saprophyticus]|nr:alpha/beta hydrolase [Staphylococcus saprophyticus]
MIRKIATIVGIGVATSYLYAKVKEKRSYKSFLEEIIIRATKMKSSFLNVENAQQALEKVKDETKALYEGTDYYFNHNVQTTTVQESTVYIVNDNKDRQQPVVLYIHGGAWFQNPLKYHFDFIDSLAGELGAKVIMPIYPKVPHATYKETFTLLETLYTQLLKQVENPHQLTIMGDSAGGQIALSFAQYIKTLNLAQPSNIVLISPVLDATFSNPEAKIYEKIDPMLAIDGSKYFIKLWANGLDLTDWRVSPIFGDIEGLGHITISIGTKETLYPDAVKLSNMLNARNIQHDFMPGYNLFHIHPIFPIPEKEQFIAKINKIIKQN